MSRFVFTLAATAGAVAGIAALSAPANAQQGSSIAEIIVYGTDPCPRSTDDQIVVCRRAPESYRYRLPDAYRPGGTPQERESWANKAEVLETVGSTGINSCSPVGPGGYTGCLTRVIKEAREQRRQQAEDTVPPQ